MKNGLNNLFTAHSVIPKLSEDNELNIDLIAFDETWIDLSFTDNFIHLDNYDIIRKDRSRNGGGVCIYLRSSINYKILCRNY